MLEPHKTHKRSLFLPSTKTTHCFKRHFSLLWHFPGCFHDCKDKSRFSRVCWVFPSSSLTAFISKKEVSHRDSRGRCCCTHRSGCGASLRSYFLFQLQRFQPSAESEQLKIMLIFLIDSKRLFFCLCIVRNVIFVIKLNLLSLWCTLKLIRFYFSLQKEHEGLWRRVEADLIQKTRWKWWLFRFNIYCGGVFDDRKSESRSVS